MDSATQDLFRQRISEMIFDEEKTVTCWSLAGELKITFGDAKLLLEEFVKDCRQLNQHRLHVTYVLCGSLKSGQLSIQHVNEDHVNNLKQQFEIVASELIYSIRKGETTDLNGVILIDSACKLTASTGAIAGEKCIMRKMKSKIWPVPQAAKIVKESGSFFKKFQERSKLHTKTIKTVLQPQRAESKVKAEEGIVNLFSMAAKKSHKNYDNEEGINNCRITNIQAGSECSSSTVGTKTKTVNEEPMDVDIQKVSKENITPKKRKKGSKEGQPNKRRRRIQEICDSDSDIFDDDDDPEVNEDIIERSFEELQPLQVVKPIPVPKNKRRKAVDRTHVDEEGFIVTTTEYVFESASEDEDQNAKANFQEEATVLLQKNNSKSQTATETKSSTPKGKKSKKVVNGKQPTLMNFFKKK